MSNLGSLGFFVSLDVFLNRGTQIRPHDLTEASQYNLLMTTTNTIQTLLEFTLATHPADFMTSVVCYDFFLGLVISITIPTCVELLSATREYY